ncbi:protein BatD [Thiomicrospira microaerophila]|uniref:BatD family protein n=1 Tax=Thiomicrospira microaerophila TaxID=406020 RepID=UPI00200D787B|nr:BatD family protein [Thiomicrospira microaerophila]UQB42214.1 protein BatD [Thiomicrospira microaerophila]
MVSNRVWLQALLLSLSLFLLPGLVMAQQILVAHVDRDQIEQGDIIQLSVMANFQTTSRGPDFALLHNDFNVLGTQASNQLRIINGQYSATTLWDVQLMAKRTGELTIPAFRVETAESQPIRIEVSPASQRSEEFRISFLEAEVDNRNPYVQSQVIYTLRYYHLGSLIQGNINPPQFNQMISERLQNQRNFERRVQGRVYRVYEWVYAIYPQASGELVIPPQTFDGRLLYERAIRLDNQASEPIKLQVKPIPASFPANATWLPAKRLMLKDEWTNENQLEVGDTLGRRISIEASGLRASQLPNPDWPQGEGFRLYSDPVNQRDHYEHGGISSIKSQDFMAVLQQAGKLDFEPIEIPWWNTQTDQLEIARLEGRSIQVATTANNETPSLPMESLTAPESMVAPSRFWPFVSALFALLWLITLWLYWQQRQQAQIQQNARLNPTHSPDTQARPALEAHKLQGLCQLPIEQLEPAVKSWLKQQGIEGIHRLKTDHPALYSQLIELEKTRYSQNQDSQPELDRQAIEQNLAELIQQKTQPKPPLHPLYPE